MLNLKTIITNPPDGLSQMEVAYYIVAHRYIQCEANAAIKQELADAGLIITTYRLRHLVGEVEDWLGLSCDEKSLGRPSITHRQRLLRRWKRVNGHPTLELLLAGWEPNSDWRSVAKKTPKKVSNSPAAKLAAAREKASPVTTNDVVADEGKEQVSSSITDDDFKVPKKEMTIKIT